VVTAYTALLGANVVPSTSLRGVASHLAIAMDASGEAAGV
jgi:hypothetical protein